MTSLVSGCDLKHRSFDPPIPYITPDALAGIALSWTPSEKISADHVSNDCLKTALAWSTLITALQWSGEYSGVFLRNLFLLNEVIEATAVRGEGIDMQVQNLLSGIVEGALQGGPRSDFWVICAEKLSRPQISSGLICAEKLSRPQISSGLFF